MLDQLALGKMLQGRVVAVLTDGSSLVRLDAPMPASEGAEVRLQLPPGLNPGDELKLTLLARDPRPTFGVTLTGQLAASATTELSQAAQLIGQALQHAQDGPTALHGNTPLQPSAARLETPQLAQNLQHALESSGLFYESHLREWSEGTRQLDQLLQEPQNQASSGPAAAAQLLPQQLDTLEQRRLSWQGELWPGQQLEWTVEEKLPPPDERAAKGAPAAERSVWQTELKLDLPHLGQVSATLRLQGDHAQLQLQADNPATALALQEGRARLLDALGAAGTALDTFVVKVDDKPS